MLINALVFGTDYRGTVLEVDVIFKPRPQWTPPTYSMGTFSRALTTCYESRCFQIITLGYSHTFVHEMGHALAMYILTGYRSKVKVYTAIGCGLYNVSSYPLNDRTRSMINYAGPMSDLLFSTALLVGSVALKSLIGWPVAALLAGGTTFWLVRGVIFNTISIIKKDSGDFGQIARLGKWTLAIATAALVSQYALAVFVATMLL